MSLINIDLHILKKIVLNDEEIDRSIKDVDAQWQKIKKLLAENRALLEFIADTSRTEDKGEKT